MRVAGKVIVVVGAASGIGREAALELLRRGASVAAVDLRQQGLDETVELAAAGDRLQTLQADITDRAAVAELPRQVLGQLGAIDGLVNMAGIIQPFVPLNDLDHEAIERVISVNLYGTIHTVKAFLPHLLERPIAHVANVSSMGGFLPVPGQTVYGASKAGVKLLTEGLYAELLETSVGVTVVMPGAVETDITGNSGVEAPGQDAEEEMSVRMTAPADAARMIVDGVERDRLHVFVGRDSRMMNLLTRLMPRRAAHVIQRQMRELLPS